MRVFFREELQAITKLLEELKALFIACVHGGKFKGLYKSGKGHNTAKSMAWR
jgi:hypothetical protein